MCGIVGFCGEGDAKGFVLEALKSLEYRGYDSAGVATIGTNGHISLIKRAGPVTRLGESLNGQLTGAHIGIGHTRWATHGAVNDINAHPHLSYNGQVAIAHNGIIENYIDLRKRLQKQGITFRSQTDSEVIAHLIAKRIEQGQNLYDATRNTAYELDGLSVILAMSSSSPNVIVGTKVGYAGSLILGSDNGHSILASDIAAIPNEVRECTRIDHCEAVIISQDNPVITHLDGSAISKTSIPRASEHRLAYKGNHPHFMHKEIADQSSAIQGAMHGRADFTTRTVDFPELSENLSRLTSSSRILLTGMGSSYFVAMAAARWIERFTGIPAYTEYAGELTDRDFVFSDDTAIIAVTQSGETYDTLSAVETARPHGCLTLAITANTHSQVSRLVDHTIDIGTGLEVGVAGTKTVTSSMMTLYLLALQLGNAKGMVSDDTLASLIDDLATLPRLMNRMISMESDISKLAHAELQHVRNMLYLGRGDLYPVALEGALKMKEISYVHAEGCTASEMKHGVNALIDSDTPTVALVPDRGELRSKMIASINEVQTRSGEVFAVANENDNEVQQLANRFIPIPNAPRELQPFLMMIPLQQLAYHNAISHGFDPDRPRNLAKTVTVA